MRTLAATRGFSLLEVIISLALLVALTAIGFTALRSLRGGADVTTTSHQLLAALELARTQTLASLQQSNYGVHLEPQQYVIFKGASYNPAAPDNVLHSLGSDLEIYEVMLGGGSDVVFNRIDGTTATTGTVGIRRLSDPADSQSLTILGAGVVGITGAVTAADTRLTDTRHLHFDLGWSIRGANTLALTFTDAGVVEEIEMAPYFTADQSAFDWEGTVNVNGNNETLRMHTHDLTAVATVLSIHRDRRDNELALAIAIDGQTIVAYEDDGTATVGAAGGILTSQ